MYQEETTTLKSHEALQPATVNVQFLNETHSSSFHRACQHIMLQQPEGQGVTTPSRGNHKDQVRKGLPLTIHERPNDG